MKVQARNLADYLLGLAFYLEEIMIRIAMIGAGSVGFYTPSF